MSGEIVGMDHLIEDWITEHNRRLGGDMVCEEKQISREAFAAGFSAGVAHAKALEDNDGGM